MYNMIILSQIVSSLFKVSVYHCGGYEYLTISFKNSKHERHGLSGNRQLDCFIKSVLKHTNIQY